jgi:hypothetical protein
VNRSLCTCPIPHRGYATEVRPRGDQFCTCGGAIDPSWASTDKAMDEFYDRLEILPTNREPVPGTDPPVYVPTAAFKLFRMDASSPVGASSGSASWGATIPRTHRRKRRTGPITQPLKSSNRRTGAGTMPPLTSCSVRPKSSLRHTSYWRRPAAR